MTIPGIRAIGCGTTSDYLELFENSGHPVFVEEPQRFNQVVDEFAKTH